jgi:predicted MFS family arabinose efflux permease
MYVNCVFAIFAIGGAVILLHNVHQEDRPRIDVPGTLTVSMGLLAIVFGFNRAQIDGWGAALTLVSLAVGIGLLLAFVLVELRVLHPLLPLRVPADRNRGASYLAILFSGAAIFGVFLFLTYYLQENRGYSPVKTGLAFLPLTGAVLITAPTVSSLLLVRVGPRVLVTTGMLLCGAGMAIFAQIGLHTSYASTVLIGELVLGAGLGFVFSTAINASTVGVEAADAGVASALVNACQQVGGALGVALLSTIAASATSHYAAGHHGAASLASSALIHGYTVAFWVSAGLFAAGAVSSLLLYERDVQVVVEDGVAPVLAH